MPTLHCRRFYCAAGVTLETVLLRRRRYIVDGFTAFHALLCRRSFNAAGVTFQSPGLASGSEDPGGQPWVSGPAFPERCRRSIPSGVIAFLMNGCHTTCPSSANGTPAAFGASCAAIPRAALQRLRPRRLPWAIGSRRVAAGLPATPKAQHQNASARDWPPIGATSSFAGASGFGPQHTKSRLTRH